MTTESLSHHIEFILENYHRPLKEELPVIIALAEKAASVHGDAHPELIRMSAIIREFYSVINEHLYKEENVLFVMMHELDGFKAKRGIPSFHCGSIANPIRKMEGEHRIFDDMFTELRTLSNDFTPPQDACRTYSTLFTMLQNMDRELQKHAAYEEEHLFPDAQEVELACKV